MGETPHALSCLQELWTLSACNAYMFLKGKRVCFRPLRTRQQEPLEAQRRLFKIELDHLNLHRFCLKIWQFEKAMLKERKSHESK